MQISSTASSTQADMHFRAVCRALVAETLEFSDFLAKVTSGEASIYDFVNWLLSLSFLFPEQIFYLADKVFETETMNL